MHTKSDYQYCSVETQGSVLIITINRPTLHNALHPPANRELAALFSDFQVDKSLRVAIITGGGDHAFCAGNDVKFSATASLEEMKLPEQGFGGLTSFFERSKPVIAAVNGFAYGGGFEIALAADLIIASENAKFALPEPKIGLAALGGGIHRLSRQIPYKKAVEMLITGKSVSAEEGLELGFVNQVCNPEDLMECSLAMASRIEACSPVSIDVTMSALAHGQDSASLVEASKNDTRLAKKLFTSKDFSEGVKAFAEKRKPVWPGE